MARALAFLAVTFLASPGWAISVTHHYALRVTTVSFESGSLVGALSVGDLVTGHFRYQTPMSPTFASATSAEYAYDGGAAARIGSTEFLPVLDPPTPGFYTVSIHLADDHVSAGFPSLGVPTDQIRFEIDRDLESADGTRIDLGIHFFEVGPGATFVDDLALPEALPLPTAGTMVSAFVLLSAPSSNLNARAELISFVTTLPEASTMPLLAVGGVVMLALGRR